MHLHTWISNRWSTNAAELLLLEVTINAHVFHDSSTKQPTQLRLPEKDIKVPSELLYVNLATFDNHTMLLHNNTVAPNRGSEDANLVEVFLDDHLEEAILRFNMTFSLGRVHLMHGLLGEVS